MFWTLWHIANYVFHETRMVQCILTWPFPRWFQRFSQSILDVRFRCACPFIICYLRYSSEQNETRGSHNRTMNILPQAHQLARVVTWHDPARRKEVTDAFNSLILLQCLFKVNKSWIRDCRCSLCVIMITVVTRMWPSFPHDGWNSDLHYAVNTPYPS